MGRSSYLTLILGKNQEIRIGVIMQMITKMMRSGKIRVTYLIIVLIMISALFCNCGLPNKSTVQILLEADLSNTSDNSKETIMEELKEVISKRIYAYGVSNPVIQQQGENRLLVELPGNIDIEAINTLLTTIGFLEFREVERTSTGTLIYLKDYLSANVTGFFDPAETGNRIFVNTEPDASGTRGPMVFLTMETNGLKFADADGNVVDNATLQKYNETPSWIVSRGDDGTALTGALLEDVQPNLGGPANNIPQVDIEWNAQGTVIFDEIAARLYDPLGGLYNLKYVLGIFLDNTLLSAPKINSSSFDGIGTISGNFTIASAEELANLLKSAALPVPVIIVTTSTVAQLRK